MQLERDSGVGLRPAFSPPSGDPDLVLAAYRVDDSPMNVITPLNVCLAVMVGFARKHVKEAGIGIIVVLMPALSIVLGNAWTALIVLWFVLGISLSPARGTMAGLRECRGGFLPDFSR